ncbi:MAG: hypothetical protein QM610_02480 [Chitinophagaceae bacterium]
MNKFNCLVICTFFFSSYSYAQNNSYDSLLGIELQKELYTYFFNDYSFREKDSSKIYFIALAVHSSENFIADSISVINEGLDPNIVNYIKEIKSKINIKKLNKVKLPKTYIFKVYVFYDFISNVDFKSLIQHYHIDISKKDLLKMVDIERDKDVKIEPTTIIRVPSFSKIY